MTSTKPMSANATLPPLPTITPESTVLSTSFVLPKDAQIVYSQLQCADTLARPDTYELARRSILVSNGSKSLLESMLPVVQLREESSLWVFAITAKSELEQRRSQLGQLSPDGLKRKYQSFFHFSPRDIYPCSVPCSTRPTRCASCPASLDTNAASCSSIVCQLPREPLRRPFSLFLQAVRLRLLDDIVQTAHSISPSKPSTGIKSVKRFKDGFLFHPGLESNSEWTRAWNFNASSRPMLYCHLKIHLSSSRIVVHPILRPTNFTNFMPSPSLTSGTPLILLPYGTSAYFISTYAGSTSALNVQFAASLKGMGAGDDWTSSYVVCYIKVENRNGEEKGLTAIWPTKLCLGYRSGGDNRLDRLPALPPQLQPSPALAARQAKTATTAPINSPAPPTVVTPAPTPIAIVEPVRTSSEPFPPFDRPALASSPTSAALSIFRTLSLGKEPSIRDVASEAGFYVEAVVKGRERERERIRKDRENANDHAQSLELALPQAEEVVGMPGQMTHDSPVVAIFQQNLPPPAPPPSLTPSQSQQVAQTVQEFYPSPNSTGSGGTGVASAQGLTPDVTAQIPPPASISNSTSSASASSFPGWTDPLASFGATDSTFDLGYGMGMNMNMDLDLDFGQGQQSSSTPQVSSTTTATTRNLTSYGGMSTLDELFTDDDFNFFDAPSKTSVPDPPAPSQPDSVLPFEAHNAYVSPAPTNLPFSLSTFDSWSNGLAGVGASMVGAATPAESPNKIATGAPYHSPPATPRLIVDEVLLSPLPHRTDSSKSAFQPIQFAVKHRFADDKYHGGKFALPKPAPASPTRGHRNAKFVYEGKTNPRLAIVKKLIGAKRKPNFSPAGERARKNAFGLPSPSWEREYEEWMPPMEVDEKGDKQMWDSEDEDEEMDDPISIVDEQTPFASRPATPQPDYLPLGPTLLHTQFDHSQLLALSTPLRSSASSPGPGLPMVSVPTPVSPAAALNANSEKNRVYEAVGLALAKEVVENSVWADAWMSSEANRSKPKRSDSNFDLSDLGTLEKVLGGIPGTNGQLNMDTLYHLDKRDGGASLFSFESPKVIVSKGEAIVQVLPTAFRFWDKLGLGPQSGQKKLMAYVLTERFDDATQDTAALWLDKVSSIFRDKKMGIIAAGCAERCTRPGVIPLHFEHFRKELELVLSSIPHDCVNPTFLAAIPTHLMSLNSPIFRQVMAAVSRAQKSASRPFVFRCVPEELLFGSRSSERFLANATDLCLSIYDRVLKPIAPSMLRRNLPMPVPEQSFQAHAFTLARNEKPKVLYLRQSNVPTTSAIDRHTLLHVGYQVSCCGRWLMASCVDQRGEGHDLGVWLMHPEDTTKQQIVSCVWNFADAFAKKASVEWRIAISRIGAMSPAELEAWISHLAQVVTTGPPKQVSVLSVERDSPWIITGASTIPTPASRQPSATGNSVFIDVSRATVAIETPRRFPLSCGIPTFHELTRIPTCVLDTNEEAEQFDSDILPLYSTALIHLSKHKRSMLQLHLLHTIKSPNSTLTTQDKDILSDITFSFHDLGVLTKWKRRMKESDNDAGSLPWHLAALDTMEIALVDFFSQL